MKNIISLVLFCTILSHSADSKVFSKIGSYMPNFMEWSAVVAVVNAYMATATFIRATNANIRLAQDAQKDIERTKDAFEKMYGTIQSLQNVNIYNMDSWADWLDRAEGAFGWQYMTLRDLMYHSFLENPTDLTLGYYANVKRGLEYDVKAENIDPMTVLTAYYTSKSLQSAKNNYSMSIYRTAGVKIARKNQELLQQKREALAVGDLVLADQIEAKIKLNNAAWSEISDNYFAPTPKESQMNYALTLNKEIFQSIPFFEHSVLEYRATAMKLLKKFDAMRNGGSINFKRETDQLRQHIAMGASESYSATDPDKVKSPVDRASTKEKNNPKLNKNDNKEGVAFSDYIYLKNEAKFILLQQEQTLLDLETNALLAVSALAGRKSYDVVEDIRHKRLTKNSMRTNADIIKEVNNVHLNF